MWLCLSRWLDNWTNLSTSVILIILKCLNIVSHDCVPKHQASKWQHDSVIVLRLVQVIFYEGKYSHRLPWLRQLKFFIINTSFPGNDDFILLNTQDRRWCYIRVCFMQCSNYAEVKFVSLDGKTTNDTIKTCHHRSAIIKCHCFISEYVPPNLGRLKINLEVVCSVVQNYMIYYFFSLK